MAFGVETGQALLQRQRFVTNGRDDDSLAFHGDVDALVRVQMRGLGNGGGQAHAEVVAPVFDVENGGGHDRAPANV